MLQDLQQVELYRTFLSWIVGFEDNDFLDCITGRIFGIICSQERNSDSCFQKNSFVRIRHYLNKSKPFYIRVNAERCTDHLVKARVPATVGHSSKWHTNRVLGYIRIVSTVAVYFENLSVKESSLFIKSVVLMRLVARMWSSKFNEQLAHQ
jgi:hypothetical protein